MRRNPSPARSPGLPADYGIARTLFVGFAIFVVVLAGALAVSHPTLTLAFVAGVATAWLVSVVARRARLIRDPTTRGALFRVPFTDITVEL